MSKLAQDARVLLSPTVTSSFVLTTEASCQSTPRPPGSVGPSSHQPPPRTPRLASSSCIGYKSVSATSATVAPESGMAHGRLLFLAHPLSHECGNEWRIPISHSQTLSLEEPPEGPGASGGTDCLILNVSDSNLFPVTCLVFHFTKSPAYLGPQIWAGGVKIF